jgi:hypothetical protein
MRDAYSWRGSCEAGDVTAVAVGSRWLAFWIIDLFPWRESFP